MRAMTLVNRIGLALLTLLVLGLVSGLSQGAKPGGDGGPAPPGVIFFHWGSEFGAGGSPPYYENRGFWSMNADGSGKQLHYRPQDAHDLSYAVHQGHRWFLARGPSPNNARWALYAVRDDGDPDSVVLLVEDAALTGDRYMTYCHWAKDDSFVSFGAVDAANVVDEIWVAAVAFDSTTGVPYLTTQPVRVVTEPLAIGNFDFSPLGDEVVYTLADPTGAGNHTLRICDLVSGATRLLVENAIDPFWAPDGSRIAFLGGGIETINPDGSGRLALRVEGGLAGWSPDSKHLLYHRIGWKNGPSVSIYYADVMRIAASGGNPVNLTKDIDGFAEGAYWRP